MVEAYYDRLSVALKYENTSGKDYRSFKRYIARNPRVLNGYSYQVFSQIAAQSDPI